MALTTDATAGSQKPRGLPDLPSRIGIWALEEEPRRIEAGAIFDYMDGAGELYLGYRFKHIDVYDYTCKDDNRLLVEIYRMETSDDAFGLLSLDWEGEPTALSAECGTQQPPGALYGAGLLRIWSHDIFARVLAERETPESREAVLELGRRIVGGRPCAHPPPFLEALPTAVPGYRFRAGRSAFLRSYLVLNSIYFLSSRNILNLDLGCQAAAASYELESAPPEAPTVTLLLIRYPSEKLAGEALESFRRSYFEERKAGNTAPVMRDEASPAGSQAPSANSVEQVCHVEDGWAGCVQLGKNTVLAFECPSAPAVRGFLEHARRALRKWEKDHE